MIKTHRSTNNQYYFTVQANNGKTLATSETYKSVQSMMKGIEALINVCEGQPIISLGHLKK